jgi:hypothetical protein
VGSVSSLSRLQSAAASVAAGDVVRHDDSRLSGNSIVARPGDDLNAKIAALTPGQTLLISGRHVVTSALVAVSGTSTLPITIRGDGTATIEHTDGRTGTGYALTITGSYLHFADFTAQEAAKAIVVQGTGAQHITFERVVGRATKNEAWKFRQGASYIHLWDCVAEDTGLGASFGEGFYVGESSTNWLPTPGITPDTTSYVRFERCTTRRTRNDGFDLKEGAHHIVVKDCLVDKPSATIADSQGDSCYYNRADTVQFINCHGRSAPGDGFKPYDVTVNSIIYGRGVEIWGGLIEGAGGAGVASQSDDLKVYSNFAIAGTVVGGRTNVVGGGWTSAYDPATFTEMTWSSPALMWRVELKPHGASHATGGQDVITPAMIGAEASANKNVPNGYLGLDSNGYVTTAVQYGATETSYGILKLSGDLAGDYASQTVPALATKVNTSDTRLSVKPYPPVTLTPGATPALNASLGTHFRIAMAGNYTIAAPSSPTDGQVITIEAKSDGTARTLALNTGTGGFGFGSDITALTATAINKTDFIQAVYNQTANKWWVIGYVKGY